MFTHPCICPFQFSRNCFLKFLLSDKMSLSWKMGKKTRPQGHGHVHLQADKTAALGLVSGLATKCLFSVCSMPYLVWVQCLAPKTAAVAAAAAMHAAQHLYASQGPARRVHQHVMGLRGALLMLGGQLATIPSC